MAVTSRNATVRDFAIFQVKLALDGMNDLVAFNLSIVAPILDFISGQGAGLACSTRWCGGVAALTSGSIFTASQMRSIDSRKRIGSSVRARRRALGREEAPRRLRAVADELRGKPGLKGPGDPTAN
jgi:hypothetical protein